MNRIQKIKSYFIKHEFYSWKGFDWNNFDLKFKVLDDEMLLDIGNYVKSNLGESSQIANNRHRLKENLAVSCESLDELLPFIEKIVTMDYEHTLPESIEHHWDFQYFINEHQLCENTLCISNVLKANNGSDGNCVYPLISIRKYNNIYYCWNHLE